MNDLFSIVGFLGVIIYFNSKHRESLSRLNKWEKLGVFISYILTSIIAGFCIYYGAVLLTGYFENGFVIFMIKIAIVLVALYIAIHTLNRLVQKITKGVFPDNT